MGQLRKTGLLTRILHEIFGKLSDWVVFRSGREHRRIHSECFIDAKIELHCIYQNMLNYSEFDRLPAWNQRRSRIESDLIAFEHILNSNQLLFDSTGIESHMFALLPVIPTVSRTYRFSEMQIYFNFFLSLTCRQRTWILSTYSTANSFAWCVLCEVCVCVCVWCARVAIRWKLEPSISCSIARKVNPVNTMGLIIRSSWYVWSKCNKRRRPRPRYPGDEWPTRLHMHAQHIFIMITIVSKVIVCTITGITIPFYNIFSL